MAAQFVVGLFESKGIAEDACNRLRTEGVPDSEFSLKLLREVGPVPATVRSELAFLAIDPLVFGNVQETFARFIRNGETAVFVRAATAAAAEFAGDVLRQYLPLAIEVIEPTPAR